MVAHVRIGGGKQHTDVGGEAGNGFEHPSVSATVKRGGVEPGVFPLQREIVVAFRLK